MVTTPKEFPLLCLARGISDLLVCGCVCGGGGGGEGGGGGWVNVSGRSDMLFLCTAVNPYRKVLRL